MGLIGGAHLEWVAPITDRCAALGNPNGSDSSDFLGVLRPLMAYVAPRALHSGLWVRRLVNSWVAGFANGGNSGLGGWLVSEVDDGTGQEDPDRLIRCLVENAYGVWVKRDKLN